MPAWVSRLGVRISVLAVAGYLATTPTAPAAQQEPLLVIAFDRSISLRQLAHDYLGDPDLWTEILRTSGLTSIVDLRPGQELRLPVSQVKAANRALQLSQKDIQRANRAGAQLFAPRIIALAIGYYNEALIKRTLGAWLETFDLAQQSRAAAGEAYEVCRQNREQAAEARLSDKQGAVEGQKPRELVWEDREPNAILIEEEKVRTLSDSTAQITFRDASRLRLNPNSQAVIQRLRVDPLTREEDAEVSLIEGDFYALLADKSDRKRFEVEVPGVEARIDSGDFWVSHDANEGAKFANYDVAPVRIAARGETVVLRQNEGALVRPDDSPVRKLDVLRAPLPQAPAEDRPAIAGRVRLRWSTVADAAGYWLEIAHDPQFNRMATSQRGVPETEFRADLLAPGIYYWRVSALDRFGLPGARSEARRLEVRSDTVPPYLLIERPEPDRVLRQAPVTVSGRSEPGARLTVEEQGVGIDDAGRFEHNLSPTEGDNVVTVRVVDPAGNETTRSHHITYMPDRPAEIRYLPDTPRLEPGHFLANGDTLSLAGRTLGHARLLIQTVDGAPLATAAADGAGRFRVNVPLAGDRQELDGRVISPSGYVTPFRFRVTVDREAPEIHLDAPLPRLTTETGLRVRGRLSETAKVRLNGREVPVVGGRFARHIELAEGDNRVDIVAADPAGNVGLSRWKVQRDTTPPELLGHRLVTDRETGSATIRVTVTVRDASGLARIAPCTIVTRYGSSSGFLLYNDAADRYEGLLRAAQADPGGARLTRVELTDDAGNRRVFSPN
ncbi:MAG: FecR domain-containing protein [Thermoanaerobaculia bacterium]